MLIFFVSAVLFCPSCFLPSTCFLPTSFTPDDKSSISYILSYLSEELMTGKLLSWTICTGSQFLTSFKLSLQERHCRFTQACYLYIEWIHFVNCHKRSHARCHVQLHLGDQEDLPCLLVPACFCADPLQLQTFFTETALNWEIMNTITLQSTPVTLNFLDGHIEPIQPYFLEMGHCYLVLGHQWSVQHASNIHWMIGEIFEQPPLCSSSHFNDTHISHISHILVLFLHQLFIKAKKYKFILKTILQGPQTRAISWVSLVEAKSTT